MWISFDTTDFIKATYGRKLFRLFWICTGINTKSQLFILHKNTMRLSLFFLFLFSSFNLFSQDLHLFIGTYTNNNNSKGIYVYRFNSKTGEATWISNTDSAANPSYLSIAPNGKYVYAVYEQGGQKNGQVSAYAFDRTNSRLRLLNQQSSGGDHPCYVATSKDNNWVAVGNYTGGSLAIYAVNMDGSLTPAKQVIQHEGSSVNKSRQEKPHVHATVFSPKNDYLFVPDLGIDKVMVYKFTPAAAQPLQPAQTAFAASKEGSGPRHFTFHPNGKYAYLIEELTGTVAAYQYNNGTLTSIQKIETHPSDYTGTIGSADIHVSPDGKFLYASNRGDANNITIFSINSASGKITLVGYQPTMGATPRNFMIDPTGNFLLVANQKTNNIVIFKRDKQTGKLQPTGKQIEVPSPVCLKMIK